MRSVHIGCSGWNYAHWREVVYPRGLPARSWLAHYATLFDTVELNNTFYRLPSRDAVARWVATTPPDHVFAVKASRYLTHIRRLRDLDEGVRRFYERIDPLVASAKMGPVLWQLPERFHRDDERLAQALAGLPRGRGSSRRGAGRRRCSRTSTTTGRASPSTTRAPWRRRST